MASTSNQAVTTREEDAQSLRMGRARAALVVYRIVHDEPRFLLISAANDPGKLTLPGGKIDRGEKAVDAAVREAAEEAGVLTAPPITLSEYLHPKRKRRVHPTQTFLAHYAGSVKEREDRTRLWLSLDELHDAGYQVRKPIRKQLQHAANALRDERVAA